MLDFIPPQTPNAYCGLWFPFGLGGKQGKSADIIMFRVVSYVMESDGNITELKRNQMTLG